MIGSSAIDKATQALLAAAPPGSRVILFGSQATGTTDAQSDVDILVVEPEVRDRVKEMLRLGEVLRPLRLPVDLLVLSSRAFERWKDTPNSVAYRVAREGNVYGPAA
jgi:predicted nucleotidyltransferase